MNKDLFCQSSLSNFLSLCLLEACCASVHVLPGWKYFTSLNPKSETQTHPSFCIHYVCVPALHQLSTSCCLMVKLSPPHDLWKSRQGLRIERKCKEGRSASFVQQRKTTAVVLTSFTSTPHTSLSVCSWQLWGFGQSYFTTTDGVPHHFSRHLQPPPAQPETRSATEHVCSFMSLFSVMLNDANAQIMLRKWNLKKWFD